MTYVASVIGSNPQNYWRLNEGSGASAALDYGNFPGMLWPDYGVTAGVALYGAPGYGYGGITADGGSLDCGPTQLVNRVSTPSATQNPYVPLPDPGTLEAWYFNEQVDSAVFIGWFAPNAPVNQQNWGLTLWDSHADAQLLTNAGVLATVSPLGQWHHVALSWGGGTGFIYVDGAQRQPISYAGSVAGGHVHFIVGGTGAVHMGSNVSGLVTELATYRRTLTVGDLDAHFDQAELKGQRPHWIGQRSSAPAGPVTIANAYSVGVTHVARTGSGSFAVPTGLRGFKLDLQPPFPPSRVSPGQPEYLWDVGWVSILDANGILAERRPNRDTATWLPDNANLATVFTHDLNPGWVLDVSELDPA